MKKLFGFIFMVLITVNVQAVNISNNGRGQAVILPYYTVNNELNTLLTVQNNSDQVKAIKLHFREGKQGKAVLTFNLYLAPQDIWVAALIAKDSTVSGHEGESSAAIVFVDTSCVPFLPFSQEFLPYEIEAESLDTDLRRATEGFIEVIEMGELDPSFGLGQMATFNGDVPVACDGIQAALDGGGIWDENNGDLTEQILPATGGISAKAEIIDVAEGALYSIAGVAFEKFYPEGSSFHTSPGNTDVPSLADADKTSLIFNEGAVVQTEWDHGYQAINALLMKHEIVSEFSVDPQLDARTELIFSFPTKRFYYDNNNIPSPPFTEIYRSNKGACETYYLEEWGRETYNNHCSHYPSDCVGAQPSNSDQYQLCYSVSVMELFNSFEPTEVSSLLGAVNKSELKVEYSGKLSLTFDQSVDTPQNDLKYFGLPVIGVSFNRYTNGSAAEGLLAQYGGTSKILFKNRIEAP